MGEAQGLMVDSVGASVLVVRVVWTEARFGLAAIDDWTGPPSIDSDLWCLSEVPATGREPQYGLEVVMARR